MFHLCGFSQSQDTAVLANMTALLDQSMQINGNDIIIPSAIPLVVGVAAIGPSLTRAQIASPSIRRSFNEEILPLDLTATPSDPFRIMWLGDNPITLDPAEQLNALMAEGAAGASRGTVLVWLADAPLVEQPGNIRTIRVTSAGTAVANVWSNITLTFNDTLPAGQYAIVGASMQSANMQAFRFVGKGDAWRPGALGITALSQVENPMFRMGGLGVWTVFEHNTPPSMDVLCNGADSSFQGVVDLVFLG